MKIPTARVERSVFFFDIFQFVGKLGERTLFALAWGFIRWCLPQRSMLCRTGR